MNLNSEELVRYGRHLILPEVGQEGQEKLKASKVLCVGAGGLGSPLMTYLAAAGVGKLGLVDDDVVEFSNLHRQPIHFTDDVGRDKLESAAEKIRSINPNVEVELHKERLNVSNALSIVGGYDVIADGTDNFAARFLINDACVMAGKPNVHAAIFRFEGQLSVFDAKRGPCYRCLFPEPPPPGFVPSCAEAGVLGVLPGVAGCLQATEVLKLLLGIGDPLIGRLLSFNLLDVRFHEIRFAKDPDCPVCSANPSITALQDLEEHCGTPKRSPPDMQEMTVGDLKRIIDSGGPRPILVDVREAFEVVTSQLPYRHHIPMGSLSERYAEIERDADVVVYCRTGARSAVAVDFLLAHGYTRVKNLKGGIVAYMAQR